jgi:hypothetical protein
VLAPWHIDVEEDYHETVDGSVRVLELHHAQGAHHSEQGVRHQVEALLAKDASLRSRAVTWEVRGISDTSMARALTDALRAIWNGMRRLPYMDLEIAQCAAAVVTLIVKDYPNRQKETFAECFGEPFLAGFACEDGSGTFAHVSQAALLAGLRPDLKELLSEPYRENVSDDLERLFLTVDEPSILFEFGFLRERFVQELIPSQVANERELVIYNPAKLSMFGNP